MIIRDLRADEVSVRVQSIFKNKALLLIYKDARVDMNILNEIFGVGFWKREHRKEGDFLICRVSIYNKETKEWAYYEDVGVEGNYQKDKSLFSDSFKRACFNIGIGMELYTAPKIVITLTAEEMANNNKIDLFVDKIAIKEKSIIGLIIKDRAGRERFNNYQKTTKQGE